MDTKDISRNKFAPVVSVLGHVDHGKTSLLDKIRSSQIAAREHGGITQKIGASQIEIDHEGKKRKITFIDTPGHEAFANIRSQGVNAADVVLLIVAADDGVMPQTRESIAKILEAKIPYIVVFTKIDVEGVSIERAKQSVAREGILFEGLGGNVPFIGVSSKTGEKIQDLLDLIVLVYDMAGSTKDSEALFTGVVIDSSQDKRRGVVATVVVKSGKIGISSLLFTHGKHVGKVRAIIDANGKNTREAVPGDAIEILGFSESLPAGSVIFDQETAPAIVDKIAPVVVEPLNLTQFLASETQDYVPVILKTESAAELEAVIDSLPDKVKVISSGQGEIGVADILLAKDFKALVLAFNVDINREAKTLAESEKIFYKSYGIIYQLLDELSALITSLEKGEVDREIGKGEILTSFLGSSGTIIGVKVVSGRFAVGDKIKVMRSEKEMGKSKIVSIRHGKEDAKVASGGTECGIMIEPDVDFAPQDAIIAYSKS